MARTQIRTFTGLLIDPFELTEGDIRVEDIARSNTLANRYNGHTNFPYSVTQHECLLAWSVPQLLLEQKVIRTRYEYRMVGAAALLHDGSETWVQDIVTPVKHRLSIENISFNEFEEGIQKLLFAKFDIPWEFMEMIIPFDKRIYEDEARVLKPGHVPSGLQPIGVVVEEWPDWRRTEQTFYETFRSLELKDGSKH